MELNKWKFQKELNDLCEKCTKLKPSTAKKHAKKLFDKFSEDGCISFYTEKQYIEQRDIKINLFKALRILNEGCIISENSVLKLEDVSYVEFKENGIQITTKNKQVILYSKEFEYLKYVFNYTKY